MKSEELTYLVSLHLSDEVVMSFVSALWVDRRIVDTLLPKGFLVPDVG